MTPLETPKPTAENQATRNVLVVDDELRVRELCGLILEKMGCHVTLAGSGEEALAHLSPGLDLLLVDLHMPGKVGGKDLAVRARARGDTEVIIMTAFPDVDSAVQAVKSGVGDYLLKPFTTETLRASVERCFQKRDLLLQLRQVKDMEARLENAYEELAWSEKVKGVYGQFTSPDVVRMVLEHPNDFWKRGEEREVSLLMAEVTSFPQGPDLPPEEKIELLNRIFNFLTEAIQHEMGHVNRIHGEALLALFGAPVSIVNHAAAAVRAAGRIRNLWGAFSASQKFPKAAEAPGIKLAVHAGRVVAGCLGVKSGTEYSVIGAPVRQCEELLKSGKPGQILASFEAVRRTHQDFNFVNHGLCIGAVYHDEVWELEP